MLILKFSLFKSCPLTPAICCVMARIDDDNDEDDDDDNDNDNNDVDDDDGSAFLIAS